MLRLIARSLWIPIQNFTSVLQIFWPALLVAAPITAIILKFPNLNSFGLIASILLLWAYFFFVFSSGIVNWHRKIVLDEPNTMARFIPNRRDWRYIGCVLLLLVASIICVSIISYVVFRTGSKVIPTELLNNNWYSFNILLVSAYAIGIFLFAYFFRQFVLILPSLSVGDANYFVKESNPENSAMRLRWVAAIAVVSLISELLINLPNWAIQGAISKGLLSTSSPAFPYVVLVEDYAGVLIVCYGALTFATLLSLFYKENVRPEILRSGETTK